MATVPVPLTLNQPSVAGVGSVPPWKLDEFKDVSAGGICERGYGSQNKTQQTLQYLSNIKHKEKYTWYLGWGITVIPAMLDVLPKIFFDEKGCAPLREIPCRTYTALKQKMGRVSAKQLGFLLSIIPLYHNVRAIKKAIWMHSGFDPSGHTMFKVAQYGMMLSIATDHGTKSKINMPIIGYIALTAMTDAVMLANTFTNCHTLSEVIVGGGLGFAILLTADFISNHTPIGQWIQEIAHVVSEIVDRVRGTFTDRQVLLPKQMMA